MRRCGKEIDMKYKINVTRMFVTSIVVLILSAVLENGVIYGKTVQREDLIYEVLSEDTTDKAVIKSGAAVNTVAIGFYEDELKNSIINYNIANVHQIREKTYAGVELTDEFYFYRENLSEDYKKVYDEIKAGIMDVEKSISISTSIVKSDIGDVYEAVVYDNPELFWVEPGCSFSYYQSSDKVISVTPQYNDLSEDISGNRSIIEKSVENALDVMSTLDNDIEVVKYAHDYIIHTNDYVLDSSYNQNIYSSLVNGESVCAGYSHAFQYMMRKMGIPCAFVFGQSNGSHAWNLVKLDNEYYAMDVTWDDPILVDSNGNEYFDPDFYRYDYFNITDEKMSEDHIRDAISKNLPKAEGTKYSYQNAFGGNAVGTDFEKTGMVVKGVNAVSGKTSVTLSWNKVNRAEGYTIYQYNADKDSYEVAADLTASYLSCVIDRLNTDTTYKFAVKAYKKLNNKRVYGERYSEISVTTQSGEEVTEKETPPEATTENITDTTIEQVTTAEAATESEAVSGQTTAALETTSSSEITTTKSNDKSLKKFIKPKAVKIKKLSPNYKRITVMWKKGAGNIKGYQIEYSTNKKFKKAKKVIVNNRNVTKKILKKLKAKKKYYVRIRTYKLVAGKKYYSKWSGKKAARTK